jgi:hypothetical protein
MARLIGATALANEASEVKTTDLIGLKFQNETVCDRETLSQPRTPSISHTEPSSGLLG